MTMFKLFAALIINASCVNCICLPAYAQQTSAATPEPPEAVAHDRTIFSWIQKAEQCLEQDDLRGAHFAAQKALRLAGGQDTRFADDLAPVYLRSEQYQQAAALFGPDTGKDGNLSLNKAIALVKTGRLADARKCWRESQILTYHRNFQPYLIPLTTAETFEASLFLCRGITDVDQNRPHSAVWALHHALPLAPDNPLLLWYYAEALARVGHPQEARHFYQEAIKRDHGLVSQKAQAGLARLD